jgi:hypothetical protein
MSVCIELLVQMPISLADAERPPQLLLLLLLLR